MAPAVPPLAIPAGHLSEGIGSPQLPHSREEVVAFGGIPDPVSTGRRMSARVLDLPAKLHDTAISAGMSVNISNSLLHFAPEEIINNANQLGVSLGATDNEISNSVNDMLDLEAERALETIRNLAAVKPMNDEEIDALGVRVLNNLCADLAPSNQESEGEDVPLEDQDIRTDQSG